MILIELMILGMVLYWALFLLVEGLGAIWAFFTFSFIEFWGKLFAWLAVFWILPLLIMLSISPILSTTQGGSTVDVLDEISEIIADEMGDN